MGQSSLLILLFHFLCPPLLKAHQHPTPCPPFLGHRPFPTAGVISWPRTVCMPACSLGLLGSLGEGTLLLSLLCP